jgi:hypothetical protein
MKKSRILGTLMLLSTSLTHAAVVEVGDLNIIDDSSNPSDGLRYLDLSFSDGLTLADALANAQSTYSNARLATSQEWDDLFAASAIVYSEGTASDAFTTGPGFNLSLGANYDGGALNQALGTTGAQFAQFWSDPDGSDANTTTLDFISLGPASASILQSIDIPPSASNGWLLVSDASVVPLPAAVWLFGSGLIGLIGIARHKRAG